MDKSEQIISAAIRVLEKENYHTMRTAEIALTAGVAEGTLYRYFASKRELFIAVLRTITSRLEATFIQGLDPARGWQDNIRTLGHNFFHHHRETAVHYRIMYKAFSEVEDQDIRGELARVYASGLDTIRGIFLGDAEISRRADRERLDLAALTLWGLGDMLWKRQELWEGNTAGMDLEIEHILRSLSALLLG